MRRTAAREDLFEEGLERPGVRITKPLHGNFDLQEGALDLEADYAERALCLLLGPNLWEITRGRGTSSGQRIMVIAAGKSASKREVYCPSTLSTRRPDVARSPSQF